MAHEITKSDNLFVTRKAAWHGLGTIVQEAPDSATAIKLAGLDWNVEQAPCQYTVGEETRHFDGKRINYRSDNHQPLGIVGDGYAIVQNSEAFAFTDHLIGEGVKYETAGSIKGGENVWLLARLPEKKILGDVIHPFLMFLNGHDGRTAVQVCMTPVRVVCQNTINLALHGAARKWTFYHSQNINAKISEARKTLLLAGEYMGSLEEDAERLAKEKIHAAELRDFLEQMFPAGESKVTMRHAQEKIERFKACYEAEDVNDFRGTKWGVVLAMSDYTTHVPMTTDRQRERHLTKTIITADKLLDRTVLMMN